jgi:hypothetical protein
MKKLLRAKGIGDDINTGTEIERQKNNVVWWKYAARIWWNYMKGLKI